MDKKSFWLGVVTGVILLGIVLTFVYRKFAVQPDVSLTQVEVQDLKGNKVELTNFKGKPLVVNYWATWCAPCVAEFPELQKLKEEYGDKVNFVMISDEHNEKITSFSTSKTYTFQYLRSLKRFEKYGINIRPVTYVYDSNGIVVLKYPGGITNFEEFKQTVDKLLK